jgi:hypothetical protein
MHPDPVKPLAKDQAQRDSWQSIMALSDEISSLVELHDWSQLMALAEHRDVQVAAFLAQTIPIAMYTQVMLDIDALQQQHALISSELARQQQHAEEKERQLRHVREALVNSKTAVASRADVENTVSTPDQKKRH